MEPLIYPNVVLIIVDSNFHNLCEDAGGYLERLKKLIQGRATNPVHLFTVSGRYGINFPIENDLSIIEVDDKNKTVFGQTLENACMLFDELFIISIADHDPYIMAAREVATAENKTITHYRYKRKP